jgi:hypothetical protein
VALRLVDGGETARPRAVCPADSRWVRLQGSLAASCGVRCAVCGLRRCDAEAGWAARQLAQRPHRALAAADPPGNRRCVRSLWARRDSSSHAALHRASCTVRWRSRVWRAGVAGQRARQLYAAARGRATCPPRHRATEPPSHRATRRAAPTSWRPRGDAPTRSHQHRLAASAGDPRDALPLTSEGSMQHAACSMQPKRVLKRGLAALRQAQDKLSGVAPACSMPSQRPAHKLPEQVNYLQSRPRGLWPTPLISCPHPPGPLKPTRDQKRRFG